MKEVRKSRSSANEKIFVLRKEQKNLYAAKYVFTMKYKCS